MDFIIGFFRDVLDGPLYIIVTIICIILICSCIGYLAEQSINKKKKKQEYDNTHATVGDGQVQNQAPTTGLEGVEPVEVGTTPMPQPVQVEPTPQQVQMGGISQQVPAQQAAPINMPTVDIPPQQAMPQPSGTAPVMDGVMPPTMGAAPTSPMVATPPPNPNQVNMP